MDEPPALSRIEANVLNNHNFGNRRGRRATRENHRNFNNQQGVHRGRFGDVSRQYFEEDIQEDQEAW